MKAYLPRTTSSTGCPNAVSTGSAALKANIPLTGRLRFLAGVSDDTGVSGDSMYYSVCRSECRVSWKLAVAEGDERTRPRLKAKYDVLEGPDWLTA